MATQKRADMWNALLDAEMNEVYWSNEAQRYTSRDRCLAAANAILTSGTVFALFSNLSQMPLAGKAVSVLASVLSIVHATFFHTGRIKQVAALGARWKEQAIEYRLIWGAIEHEDVIDPKSWTQFEQVCRREKLIDESAFKINNRRLKKAQKQVFSSRGLENG